jgi:hypothetical protein
LYVVISGVSALEICKPKLLLTKVVAKLDIWLVLVASNTLAIIHSFCIIVPV